MREGVLQQVGSVLPQEQRVSDIGIWHRGRIEERDSDLVRLHELEHPRKQHALQLETALVICVSEHIEDILHDAEEVLLEECVGHWGIGTGEVVDNFDTH